MLVPERAVIRERRNRGSAEPSDGLCAIAGGMIPCLVPGGRA